MHAVITQRVFPRLFIMGWIYVQPILVWVGQFSNWVGQCPMSDRYFKPCKLTFPKETQAKLLDTAVECTLFPSLEMVHNLSLIHISEPTRPY